MNFPRQCESEFGESDLNSKIIHLTDINMKLDTSEELYIRKKRQAINARSEFRSRELTLKL